MIEVRALGLIFGALLLAFVAAHPTGRRALKLGDRLMWGTVALLLILAAAYPDSVNPLVETAGFEEGSGDRLLALLGFATLLLFLFVLRSASQLRETQQQLATLVENLARKEFDDMYPSPPKAGIWVVIPAFNEAESLPGVLEAIAPQCVGLTTQLLVISDGSNDGTEHVAAKAGALVLRKPLNLGGGAAVRTGFGLARSKGAEIIVTLDADGQHSPEEMANLVGPIVKDEADYVIGSRIRGGYERDSRLRTAGVRVFSVLVSLLVRRRVTDVSNGYRAIRASKLEGLEFKQGRYYAAEHLVVAAKKGLRIAEAPVHVYRRQAGKTKKGRSLWYAFSFARSILRSWLYS